MFYSARAVGRLCLTTLCLTALLSLATACRYGGEPADVEAPADSAAGAISFELAGPGGAALIVPVHLNGQGPYDFVLDTGATFTCVDQQLAGRLDLPERTGQVGLGAGVQGRGQVQIVGIDSLRVGEARASELSACVLDLSSMQTAGLAIDGLLGLNFLKSFRVTLDFRRNVLQLQAP